MQSGAFVRRAASAETRADNPSDPPDRPVGIIRRSRRTRSVAPSLGRLAHEPSVPPTAAGVGRRRALRPGGRRPRPRLCRARHARRQRQAAPRLDPGRLGRRLRALRDVVHVRGRRRRVRLHRPAAGDPVEGRAGRRLDAPAPRAGGRPAAPTAANESLRQTRRPPAPAEELYNTRIDALDITILRGGGASVGQWAREHGFQLTPDAPEVLDFYAARSPIFMAARFNADAAKERNQEQGEGTPIHLTIPMENPWVPLRILGLGKGSDDVINANVFLLTPDKPNLLPEPQAAPRTPAPARWPGRRSARRCLPGAQRAGLEVAARRPPLRQGHGVGPGPMWFTYLQIGEQSGRLRYDLAIDKSGDAALAGDGRPRGPAARPDDDASAPPTTAAPTSTTAKPKPKPAPSRPTTAAPPSPTTTPVIDPSLPVIVESPADAAAAQRRPPRHGRPAPGRHGRQRRLRLLGRRPDRRRRRRRPRRRPGRLGPPDAARRRSQS